MSKSDIIFSVLIAVPIIGGALIALRLGKGASGGTKSGGQVTETIPPLPTDNERGASLDKQKKPAAQ